jgi:hypothetical protein
MTNASMHPLMMPLCTATHKRLGDRLRHLAGRLMMVGELIDELNKLEKFYTQ